MKMTSLLSARRRKMQDKNSCKTPCSASVPSLYCLPTEILSRIFSFVTASDLVSIYTLSCPRLNLIMAKEFTNRLHHCHLGLRLYFCQESRWRYSVDMKLSSMKQHEASLARLYFVPTAKKNEMTFYTSKFLRRPVLYKVALVAVLEDLCSLPDNLLTKALTLDIKHPDHSCTTTINIPSSPSPSSSSSSSSSSTCLLAYNVMETPNHMTKARPGERWIQPTLFECDLNWLCQTKSTLSRWFDFLHSRPARRKLSNVDFTSSEMLPSNGQVGQIAELGITAPFDVHSIKHLDIPILIPNVVGP